MAAVLDKFGPGNNTDGNSVEQKRQLVERVAASELFQKSPRMREFLVYAAECTLANRTGDLREQVVEERVFGRKPEGHDTIVRVEARNLRKRLDLYFSTEGRNEGLMIVMPKGGYALEFQHRPPEPGNAQEQVLAASESGFAFVAEKVEKTLPTQRGAIFDQPVLHRKWIIGLALVAILGFALTASWYGHDQNLRKQLGITALNSPFSALLQDRGDVLLVTSDTGMLQISSLLHRPVSLDEYIARTYSGVPETNPPDLARNWNLYEFTDGREMALAGMIVRQHAQFAPHFLLRSGHQLQLQDFKDHNAILVGSPISNPWAQLYEDKLNFRCELANDGRIVFRNKWQRRGEYAQYPNEDDILHNRTYARLAFLPSKSDAGSTLLIAGTTAQSTEAAGELLLDQGRMSGSLRAMNIDPSGPPRFFELLIRSSNFVGGAIMSEVVAWRVTSAPEH